MTDKAGNAGARIAMLALAATAVLSGCAPVYRNHGYVPSQEQLSMIEVGRDTRETVGDFIGKPASSGVLESGGWYYVGSQWREYGWREPQEISREVVAISFDQGGKVSNVERYGLEHGKVVPLERRVTDSNIRGPSFFGQLLGNLGVLDASQVINGDQPPQ
ncbi:outer membrane protein assembly factor BamE [Frigidibacter sp. MR17.24]|uniref:outer membrane protein assembly factor BamE n=1 Tax=Frigidibacter sp. MR17.24 TaxID=3127345 RepID=UPI003012F5C4